MCSFSTQRESICVRLKMTQKQPKPPKQSILDFFEGTFYLSWSLCTYWRCHKNIFKGFRVVRLDKNGSFWPKNAYFCHFWWVLATV